MGLTVSTRGCLLLTVAIPVTGRVCGSTWSPADLFPTGTEEGLFLDFSDISTLYTSQTFATNISAIGDPVGGVIDKSQGLVLGSEEVTNGTFDTDTGWVKGTGWTIAGGEAVGTAVASFQAINQIIVGVSVGDFVEVSYDITITSGAISVGIGGMNEGQHNTSGHRVFRGVVATHNTLRFEARNGPFNATIDNVSVKKLPGNHLIQSTSTARPIWTRHPKSGVRNLFDGSDNPYGKLVIDNVARGSLGVDGVLSPAFSAASVQAYCRFVSAFAYAASTQHTFSATLTPQANGRYAWLATYDGTNDYGIMFDLSNGTVVGRRATADPEDDCGIEPSGSGYRVFVTFTSVASPSASIYSAQIGVSSDAALSFQSTFVGDEDVLIEDVQIEASALPTTYQTRVSQYDVTEAGVDDCYGLTFDGVDDYLVTAANLDLSGTDSFTVCSSAYGNTNNSAKVIIEQGPSSSSDPGFAVFAPLSAGTELYSFRHKTDAINSTVTTSSTYSLPRTNVITGLSEIGGDTVIRIDGAQDGSISGPASGATASDFLHIGARYDDVSTASLHFTGTLYGVTLTDYTLDAEQLAALETWTAARTPEVTLA